MMTDRQDPQSDLQQANLDPAPNKAALPLPAASDAGPAIAASPPQPPDLPPNPFPQALSKRVGDVSEIGVMIPIRKGLVPGERRTYEERLRFQIESLARRHEKGIPVELDRVTTIHFGRMIIIRPEQYLMNPEWPKGGPYIGLPTEAIANAADPFDEFVEVGSKGVRARAVPEYRSMLLVLVEFDGDIKVYMREIAQFIGRDFDRIFENCEAFPGTDDFEAFWGWIRRFQIGTDLFYATYRDLSVVRLKQLERFKRRFDTFVAKVRGPGRGGGRAVDELLDDFLRENQQYAVDFPSAGGTYPKGSDGHAA